MQNTRIFNGVSGFCIKHVRFFVHKFRYYIKGQNNGTYKQYNQDIKGRFIR